MIHLGADVNNVGVYEPRIIEFSWSIHKEIVHLSALDLQIIGSYRFFFFSNNYTNNVVPRRNIIAINLSVIKAAVFFHPEIIQEIGRIKLICFDFYQTNRVKGIF